MESSPTLQDFVLNLIYDPLARSAFEHDPHGTLEDAGLGDVTAADVQDVLPLVLDYAPLGGLPSIDGRSPVDDLTTGVANLDVAGAAAHLQSITAQLGGTGSAVTADLNVAAAGAVTVTADQLVSGVLHDGSLFGHTGVGLGLGFGTDAGVAGGLSADHDPAAGLDASVGVPFEHTVGVPQGADGLLTEVTPGLTGGALDGTVNTVTGLTGTVDGTLGGALGGTLGGSLDTVTGLTGSLGVDGGAVDLDGSGVHGATSSVVGSVLGGGTTTGGDLLPDGTNVDGTLHGVTGTVDDVVGGLTGGSEPDDGLGLAGLHF